MTSEYLVSDDVVPIKGNDERLSHKVCHRFHYIP